MFGSICKKETSNAKSGLLARLARQTADNDAPPARKTNFHMAAMLAASGSYSASDYETGFGSVDMDGVN